MRPADETCCGDATAVEEARVLECSGLLDGEVHVESGVRDEDPGIILRRLAQHVANVRQIRAFASWHPSTMELLVAVF